MPPAFFSRKFTSIATRFPMKSLKKVPDPFFSFDFEILVTYSDCATALLSPGLGGEPGGDLMG